MSARSSCKRKVRRGGRLSEHTACDHRQLLIDDRSLLKPPFGEEAHAVMRKSDEAILVWKDAERRRPLHAQNQAERGSSLWTQELTVLSAKRTQLPVYNKYANSWI
eukprot:5308044-Pleurochrysis_carterae.AAC.1